MNQDTDGLGSKEDFLREYSRELCERYNWALNTTRLDSFMDSVRATLQGALSWNHDGEAVQAAWKCVGGKGRPTLKALRELRSGR